MGERYSEYGVLAFTHPYDFFVTGERSVEPIRRAVVEADPTTVLVRPANGHRSLGEPIGGADAYDVTVDDVDGYGRLDTEYAERLGSYGSIGLGGVGRHQCVGRTRGSLQGAGHSVDLIPDITVGTDALTHFFSE